MTNKFVPLNKVRSKKVGDGKPRRGEKKKIFIAKPEASCQGKGIFLITKPSDIPNLEKYIVQEYINDPFTFNNLKFDLRIYVLVAGCDPLRIYLYQDGLVRFATEEYKKVNRQNKKDRFIHLTNFAINKAHPKFLKSDTDKEDRKSHKRSILDFFSELREKGINMEECWEEVKKIVIKTLCAIQPILKHNYHAIHNDDPFNHGCFEVLGFDILIDKKLRPYLLEVNHSPSFKTDSQVDLKVKGGLIYDTLNMLGVTIKNRNRLKKLKKSHLHRRTITGKRIKMNEGEMRRRCLEEKDRHMYERRGNFELIFPPENGKIWEPYEGFLEKAEQIYKEFTGSAIVHVERRKIVSNINIMAPSKKFGTLEKIYGFSSKKKRRRKIILEKKQERSTEKPDITPKTHKFQDSEYSDFLERKQKNRTTKLRFNTPEQIDEEKSVQKRIKIQIPLHKEPSVKRVKYPDVFDHNRLSKTFQPKGRLSYRTEPVLAQSRDSLVESKISKMGPLPKKQIGKKRSKIAEENSISEESSNLLGHQKQKRNLRLSHKTSYENRMKKYLMSPYIKMDPFLTFDRNYREKMKALTFKLQKGRDQSKNNPFSKRLKAK